jgi:undecaprenyl-diphosphatase
MEKGFMHSFPTASRFWLGSTVFATLAFGLIAVLYTVGGPLERIDIWLGEVLHDLAERLSPGLVNAMRAISWFGGTGALLIMALVSAFLLIRRSWDELLLWLVAISGAIILNRLLKELFESVRPVVGHLNIAEESTGFPSGHAMVAIVTYSVLVFLLSMRESLRRFHSFGWFAAGFMVFLIGFSRLYLTVHYLSDVLGGLAAGIAWLSFCLWLYQTVIMERLPHFFISHRAELR